MLVCCHRAVDFCAHFAVDFELALGRRSIAAISPYVFCCHVAVALSLVIGVYVFCYHLALADLFGCLLALAVWLT